MGLSDLQRREARKATRSHNPSASFAPGFNVGRSGEVISSRSPSTACPHCNSERIIPMRMPGFTLYHCIFCGEKWRDSFDKPGQILRPRELRAIRRKVGNRYGRILI